MQTTKLEQANPFSTVTADYDGVEVTILYEWNQNANTRTLLLALVEFVPHGEEARPERPCEAAKDYAYSPIGKKEDANNIALRRVLMSSERAVDWYRSLLGASSVTLPQTSEDLAKQKPRRSLLVQPTLADEPEWPNTVLLVPFAESPLPFIDVPLGGYRWHQLLPDRLPVQWTPAEKADALDWLAAQSPADFIGSVFCRSSLWGSAHMLLPNPVFRQLHLSGDGQRGLLLWFELRPGCSWEPLQLVVRVSRPWGVSTVAVVEACEPRVCIELPRSEVLTAALPDRMDWTSSQRLRLGDFSEGAFEFAAGVFSAGMLSTGAVITGVFPTGVIATVVLFTAGVIAAASPTGTTSPDANR